VIKASQRCKRSLAYFQTTPRAPRKHSPGCCIVPKLVWNDAGGYPGGGSHFVEAVPQLTN
jgi:hypothetical protein